MSRASYYYLEQCGLTLKDIDKTLIFISWIATFVFTILTLIHKKQLTRMQNNSFFNIYLIAVVLAAFYAFSWKTGTRMTNFFALLWYRLFDGTYKRLVHKYFLVSYYNVYFYRISLLLFWTLCTVESLLFTFLINYWTKKANTCHRKFFHLLISFVAITGLYHDPKLLALSSHLVLQIFIIIEVG